MELRDWLRLALGVPAVLYLIYRLTTVIRRPRTPRLSWQDPTSGYKAYQRAYDQEVAAESLVAVGELIRRRQLLDSELQARFAGTAEQIAQQLDRSLPASSRSATIVTMLLDNSGSMRRAPGAPVESSVPYVGDCAASSAMMLTACAADLLVQALESCDVKVEVLGFTTMAWHGGRSWSDWHADGRPPLPGRLNDLLHIVYKSADRTGTAGREALGVMLDASLLKENIDGEALAWAHARLLARPEPRRVLMVISDGAPVDDSTLSVNPGDILVKHLRHVIKEIETRAAVELVAVGIGHDVTDYYRRAAIITDPADLAGAMTDKLCELLAEDTPRAD
jgi:cobaltochelatase CobT